MSSTIIARRAGKKPLGLKELVAIAVGGMVGGGIFTVLGIAVTLVGVWAPVAIGLGGAVAALAAYSYVKLAVYYLDEGAAYSFFKRTFTGMPFAAALIGWWVIFGYISTIALYAFTFASYALGGIGYGHDVWARHAVAVAIIGVFTLINVWSTRGMGKIEDLLVYVKLIILVLVSVALWIYGKATLPQLLAETGPVSPLNILVVSSVTFVAYEGFQLVINATNEMTRPKYNIPRAIYTALAIVISIYVLIATGAVLAIPFPDIVANQEYALAAGAKDVMGGIGESLVIAGALLATMSAISGTLFGASRQLAAIADDGYMPAAMTKRAGLIPRRAIVAMAVMASALVMAGGLRMILEFGSITFLLVSLLMAIANHKMRAKTRSHDMMTVLAIIGLTLGAVMILWYDANNKPVELAVVVGLYAALTVGAWAFARRS